MISLIISLKLNKLNKTFHKVRLIDAHRGERGEGAPHVSPRIIFEKLPHKNAIKHDLPP